MATPERGSKRERRAQSQAKLAALRAAQARRQRRRRAYAAVAAVLSVVLVVGVLVLIKLNTTTTIATSEPTVPAPAAVVTGVTNVPLATYDAIGSGSIEAAPQPMSGAVAISADGRPRVLYVGAEYCPFCAAERWAMVAALSRFGTFTGLRQTASSASDKTDPNTPTLSFHGATYTSRYLSFTGYEENTNQVDRTGNYPTLDTPTAADQALIATYDSPPYVAAGTAGDIPFVDLGGKYVISGASYDPVLLKGKTQQQVAAAMGDPTSRIAQAIDGTANVITAALCQMTRNAPSNVCTSVGVGKSLAKLSAGAS